MPDEKKMTEEEWIRSTYEVEGRIGMLTRMLESGNNGHGHLNPHFLDREFWSLFEVETEALKVLLKRMGVR